MTKQARSLLTREAILRSAGTVFSENGYSATMLSDIVAAAGVTQGSLYFHFASKHALASELIVRQHASAIEVMESVPTGTPGLEAVVRLSVAIARQIVSDPIVRGGMRLSTDSSREFPEVSSKPYQDWIDACEHQLLRAVEDGDVAADRDIRTLGRFVMSSFTGVQVVSQALSGWDDLLPRVAEMWEIILPEMLVPSRQSQAPALLALVTPAD
jgi:AcrR family transcriptional regulator